MCGFLLCAGPGSSTVKYSDFSDALALQFHRGPDDTVIMDENNVRMGFNRVAITDVSNAARQPIRHGPITLMLNREIYNYIELRDTLTKSGISFKSKGDAEVLAAAIHTWGVDQAFRQARGMWSVVATDARNDKIIVSRDRLGIKPLWFAKFRDTLAVSTEIKSLTRLHPALKSENRCVIARYLVAGILDSDEQTFYKDIHAFPKGHYAIVDRNLEIEPLAFWSLETKTRKHGSPKQINKVLEETVRIHLRSDVPVRLALSGGLDSTILAHYACGVEGFKAYSLDLHEEKHEKNIIDQTIRRYRFEHMYIAGNEVARIENVDTLLRVLDQPFKAAQTLYQYALRKAAAADGVKVFLTGDGADEVFGGDTKCVAPYLEGFIRQGRFLKAYREARELSAFTGQSSFGALTRVSKRLARGMVGRKMDFEHSAMVEKKLITDWWDPFIQEQMQYKVGRRSLKTYLADRLFREPTPYWLRVEDGISMAVSLETRVPFLDHALIEESMSLKPAEFFSGGRNKAALRQATASIVPKHVMSARKKYQRPGSTKRLIFDVLGEVAADTIATLSGKHELLAPGIDVDRFLLDKQAGVNATFWFRVLLLMRWYDLCMRAVPTGSMRHTDEYARR